MLLVIDLHGRPPTTPLISKTVEMTLLSQKSTCSGQGSVSYKLCLYEKTKTMEDLTMLESGSEFFFK